MGVLGTSDHFPPDFHLQNVDFDATTRLFLLLIPLFDAHTQVYAMHGRFCQWNTWRQLFITSVVVNRHFIVVNPASNVAVFSPDDATPPRHVAHYEKLDSIVHMCVLVMKISIICRKSGFATSKAAFYSGKSSQQRRGVQSRRRHGPPTRVPLWKIG